MLTNQNYPILRARWKPINAESEREIQVLKNKYTKKIDHIKKI